ncbi:dihydrofolate reductase family protein [Actinomadura adrarensis]|uniref:Dihydrofolate reductase family protein n=1 Tax=Actinomadura adrarensis TaxID=1819600 RepID=A0ABW3CK41_9ACTN
MGRLIYSAIASADGFVEDEGGGFQWAAPDGEVMAFINDLERPIGTYLYGRRMYETMVFWETADVPADQPLEQDFTRIWRGADKVVFSRTLESVSSARTRIERDFEPGIVREMKSSTGHDMSIGGAELGGQAVRDGLVDEIQLYLMPVVVGGGKPALPRGVRLHLELVDTRRFASGAVFLRYLPKAE